MNDFKSDEIKINDASRDLIKFAYTFQQEIKEILRRIENLEEKVNKAKIRVIK